MPRPTIRTDSVVGRGSAMGAAQKVREAGDVAIMWTEVMQTLFIRVKAMGRKS